MIQFNLLPDVKLRYIKAKHQQKVAVMISSLVSGIFLVILILLFLFVKVGQPHHIKNLSSDIKESNKKLHEVKDLDKILTVQNQLESLSTLHNDKKISSRMFKFLVKLTPSQATISNITLDLNANTLNFTGNADTLATVNKFVDTLKFTKYRVSTQETVEPLPNAFSGVVLTSYSVGSGVAAPSGSNKQVSFSIDMTFDPKIFENTLKDDGTAATVSLDVPNIISTRSELDKPGAVFSEQPSSQEIPR